MGTKDTLKGLRLGVIIGVLLSSRATSVGAFSSQSSTSNCFTSRYRFRTLNLTPLHLPSDTGEANESQDAGEHVEKIPSPSTKENPEWLTELKETSPFFQFLNDKKDRKLPPMLVEDYNVLLYDVFLLVNLSVSISFWVVHRMDFQYISSALSEGSLLSIIWIVAGLYNGAFLYSAVDGHYNTGDERAGPSAARMLGFQTFINTASLRVLVALLTAFVEHRQVGFVPGEDLMPLEVVGGLLLMSMWRMLHSSYTPRF
mmetsp:Transcript_55/g.86  ORF Transcript_55/g.86 Transcript_55/m.86 type:complete len:257 (+) Transcript_55:22-792(+)